MHNEMEKLINRIIIEKIIEIIIVFSFIGISLITWSSFNIGISASNITTLDEYKMEFTASSTSNEDIIVVRNPYQFNKNYKVILVTPTNTNLKNTSITINNKTYILDEFFCKKQANEWKCLLINDEINKTYKKYNVKLDRHNELEHHYIFEENNNF